MIVDLSHDIFTQRTMFFFGLVKPWGFCDLALWLCGRIGSGWCQKERLDESFSTHQRMLDFVEMIKSYDHLKLLV
jgi:hypothetical protein